MSGESKGRRNRTGNSAQIKYETPTWNISRDIVSITVEIQGMVKTLKKKDNDDDTSRNEEEEDLQDGISEYSVQAKRIGTTKQGTWEPNH